MPPVDEDEEHEFADASGTVDASVRPGPGGGGPARADQPRIDDSSASGLVIVARQQEGQRRAFVQSGASHDQQLCDRILQRLGKRELFLLRTDWLFQTKVQDALLDARSHFPGSRDQTRDALDAVWQTCQGRIWGNKAGVCAGSAKGPATGVI